MIDQYQIVRATRQTEISVYRLSRCDPYHLTFTFGPESLDPFTDPYVECIILCYFGGHIMSGFKVRLRSKRFQSSYCTKVRGEQKNLKKLKMEGGGENSPFIFSSQIHTPWFHINWPSLVSTARSPIIYWRDSDQTRSATHVNKTYLERKFAKHMCFVSMVKVVRFQVVWTKDETTR